MFCTTAGSRSDARPDLKMKAKFSFGDRIRLLVLFISLGSGLAVLGAFQYVADRQIDQSSAQDVRTASGNLVGLLRGQGDLLEALNRYVAVSPRLQNLPMADRATTNDVLNQVQAEVGIDGLALTDVDGKVIGTSGLKNRVTVPPEIYPTALHGNSWRGVTALDGDLMMVSVEPIRTQGVLRGALAAFLRLGSQRAKQIRGSGTFDVLFVSGDRIIGGSRPTAGMTLHPRSTFWRQELEGRMYIARYGLLPGTLSRSGMGFVVLRPMDDTLEAYRQFTLTFVTILAIVSIVALIAGSAVATNMVRAMDGLFHAAQTMEKGEWPAPLPATRSDELGRLEATFNRMATSLQQSQNRLLEMIDIDPLTDLPNHRRFRETLKSEVARVAKSQRPMALLLIDIDHFSHYNERHGHAQGDEVLRQTAAHIRAEIPPYSIPSRYSGDGFAILMPGGELADLEALFRKLQALVPVKLSAGCSDIAEVGANAESLALAAEIALARAKELGRNQLCKFSSLNGIDPHDPAALHRILNDGTYATIRALAAAVDAKDPYTHGHSERVAAYASSLATHMGLSPEDVDRIHRCGTLHDVGKIGIPDAILQKPEHLSEDEERVMHTHPVLGEYIVGKVPQLAELLQGVRHHHERYDGLGYPDALCGDAIPVVARYLAIADTFDAMTSDRPYRKGLSVPVALEAIRKGAGTQFDPALAHAFADLMASRTTVAA